MATKIKTEPHLHLAIGHILFIDLVGYSKLAGLEAVAPWRKRACIALYRLKGTRFYSWIFRLTEAL